jgi:hypothetical protein
MTIQHTPTPWRNIDGIIYGHDDHSVGETHFIRQPKQVGMPLNGEGVFKHNAAFIVKACNQHDMLVEAIQFALTDAEEQHGQIDYDTITILRDAIAKAKDAAHAL